MEYPRRNCMYGPRLINGNINVDFYNGLEEFVEFSTSHPEWMDREKIKCPCKKKRCQNTTFRKVDDVKVHLVRWGFVDNYFNWRLHGELDWGQRTNYQDQRYPDQTTSYDFNTEAASSSYHAMIREAGFSHSNVENVEEPPNKHAQQFYDMLNTVDRDLYPGCKTLSQLSFTARLMSIKTENKISERGYNQIVQLCREICPPDNFVPKDFKDSKNLLKDMGLPVERIDCCQQGCMLYWGEDDKLDHCKRLYQSNASAKDMTWHANIFDDDPGVMRHPANSLAWKHLNQTFPDFASEIRNVRLSLSTDGFQPLGQSGKQYSSWPVMVTPYNLPPWMCMKEQYIFLSVLVPGPRNPKQNLDVFLQPLIADLIFFWNTGVETYDVARKQNFVLRAALIWTISDFPAFAMLSGWSTAGKLACPYCKEYTDAFTLK